MLFDPEVDVAMNDLRKKCRLEYTGGGHYNVISPGIFGCKKIADIDVSREKLRISNLQTSMYGFQKDELMEEAYIDWLHRQD